MSRTEILNNIVRVCLSQRERLGENARETFCKNGRHRNKHVSRYPCDACVHSKNKLFAKYARAFTRGKSSLGFENVRVHSRNFYHYSS